MAAFVDDEFTATASTTGVTITKPTGIAVGDYLIAVIRLLTGSAFIDPPLGWHTLINRRRSGSNPRVCVFGKRVTTTETAAANFSFFQTGAAAAMEGYMVAITDVSTTAQPVFTSADANSSTPTTGSVTAQANDAFLTFLIGTASAQTGDTTAPLSLTERRESDDFLYVAADQIAAGATGSLASSLAAGAMDHVVAAILLEDGAFDVDHPNVTHVITETGTSLGAANAQVLPSGSASGDLIVAFVANDNTSATDLSASTGWDGATQVGTTGMKTQVFARVLTGTTGDNILSVTGASQDYVVTMCRIPSGTHGVSSAATWLAGAVSATATGTNGTPDPPSVTPGTNDDYLWLVGIALDQTGSSSRITGVPSGYLELDNQRSAGSATSVSLSVSMRQATGTSEDPASGTATGLTEWHAWTLAVPPATDPDATIPAGVITATASMVSPVITTGSSPTPGVITATASMQAPTVAAGVVPTPTVIGATASMRVPTVSIASGATATPTVITATATMEQPLVLGQGTSIATRTFIYLSDYIATLDEISPARDDRVIHLSEQTGELTTLGQDELEGWIDPDIDQPGSGWPPGSWGGGGPGGYTGGGPPPDWGTDPWIPPPPIFVPPGGGGEIPPPPDWEPPPPDPDGEVAPDPGHDGELQGLTEAILRWDSRLWSGTQTRVFLSGTAATALQTKYYNMPDETPVLDIGSGDLVWDDYEWAGTALGPEDNEARLWFPGELGGLPYSRPFTWVVTVRPRPIGDQPPFQSESIASMDLSGFTFDPLSEEPGSDPEDWGPSRGVSITLNLVLITRANLDESARRRLYVQVLTSFSELNAVGPDYNSVANYEYDLDAEPLPPAIPYNSTSVVVVTADLPLGGVRVWVNGAEAGSPPLLETGDNYWLDLLGYGGRDFSNSYSGILAPRYEATPGAPPEAVSSGVAALAMYRGTPTTNDLAVLQWRYGR
jgi:hypothetical protein